MPDFEMPYFIDGGGNKGYFKDSTARDQIGTKQDTLTVTNITSTVTIDTTAVYEAVVCTYGKILYIYFKLKAGVTDQTYVITNLPRIKSSTGCVIPSFYMNREDYNKGCVCVITNASTSSTVQFRCGVTPTGTGGTMYSAVCLLDN